MWKTHSWRISNASLWSTSLCFSQMPICSWANPPILLKKTMEIIYVLFAIVQCAIVMIILDLWMLRFGYATFSLVINFVNQNWMHCHIIVGLFETLKVSNAIIVKQVNVPLVEFKLKNKVAPYFKDEKKI